MFPEGNTTLNYLGLSTQIPAKYVFISSGSSRKYKIGNLDLEFRHRVFSETANGSLLSFSSASNRLIIY
ncbi:MAG: DUF6088 family protein [Rickettsiales bacterium]|nr:DUF6088 family protein [Rickettsiales bacterium]